MNAWEMAVLHQTVDKWLIQCDGSITQEYNGEVTEVHVQPPMLPISHH